MKASDAFPSNFLKAEDLQGRDVNVTIEKVGKVMLGQGREAEEKIVATFVGKKKELVVNKTNFKAITAVTGEDDSDNWGGKVITLYAKEVDFAGDTVWGIRVRTPAPGSVTRAPAPAGHRDDSRGTRSAPPAREAEENPEEDVGF